MIKARATSAPWWDGVEFLLSDHRGMGVIGYAHPIEFEVNEEKYSARIIDPTFRLSMDEAQTLMNDLWNCGLRPSEGTGSAGALAATQKHLEDMRTLVFKKDSHA